MQVWKYRARHNAPAHESVAELRHMAALTLRLVDPLKVLALREGREHLPSSLLHVFSQVTVRQREVLVCRFVSVGRKECHLRLVQKGVLEPVRVPHLLELVPVQSLELRFEAVLNDSFLDFVLYDCRA